jgi:hypothetical protein
MIDSRSALRAFTMIELLLSMAIMVMMSLTLYLGVSIAFKARNSCRATIDTVRQATLALALIGDDLESALPEAVPSTSTTTTDTTTTGTTDTSTTTGTGGGATIAAASAVTGVGYMANLEGNLIGGFGGWHRVGNGGDADWIEFFIVGDDGLKVDPATGTLGGDPASLANPFREGVRNVSISLEPGADGDMVLVRRVARNLLPVQTTVPTSEVLCRGVRSFSVTYYDGFQWQYEWDSRAYNYALPIAVRLVLTINDPNARDPNNAFYTIQRTVPLPASTLLTNPTGQDTGTTDTTGTTGTGG